MAKLVFLIGLGLIALSALIWVGQKTGIPFGKLPGDFSFSKGGFHLQAPLASSLLISLILTVVINLFLYFSKR